MNHLEHAQRAVLRRGRPANTGLATPTLTVQAHVQATLEAPGALGVHRLVERLMRNRRRQAVHPSGELVIGESFAVNLAATCAARTESTSNLNALGRRPSRSAITATGSARSIPARIPSRSSAVNGSAGVLHRSGLCVDSEQHARHHAL